MKTAMIRAFGVVLLLIFCLLVWQLPNEESGKPHEQGNDLMAMQALLRIAEAQDVFSSKDSDNDGRPDYASFSELARAGLLDKILASGVKTGYRFDTQASSRQPESAWMAVAQPVIPGTTGNRFYALRENGLMYQRTAAAFECDPDRDLPDDSTPVEVPSW